MYIVIFTFLNKKKLYWGPFDTYTLAEMFIQKEQNKLAALYLSDQYKKVEIFQLHKGE